MSETAWGSGVGSGRPALRASAISFSRCSLYSDHYLEEPLAIAATLVLDRGGQVDQHALRALLPLGRARGQPADDGLHDRQIHRLVTVPDLNGTIGFLEIQRGRRATPGRRNCWLNGDAASRRDAVAHLRAACRIRCNQLQALDENPLKIQYRVDPGHL